MLDRKDIRKVFPPTEYPHLGLSTTLVETLRTKVEIRKINQINPMTIHQVLRQEKRTGRLIFDYNKGGVCNITFESVEHLPLDTP